LLKLSNVRAGAAISLNVLNKRSNGLFYSLDVRNMLRTLWTPKVKQKKKKYFVKVENGVSSKDNAWVCSAK